MMKFFICLLIQCLLLLDGHYIFASHNEHIAEDNDLSCKNYSYEELLIKDIDELERIKKITKFKQKEAKLIFNIEEQQLLQREELGERSFIKTLKNISQKKTDYQEQLTQNLQIHETKIDLKLQKTQDLIFLKKNEEREISIKLGSLKTTLEQKESIFNPLLNSFSLKPKQQINITRELFDIKRSTQNQFNNLLKNYEEKEFGNIKQKSFLDDCNSPFYIGLSIDGGGVRGLIPALYLREIEENSKKRICDLFDYIGGTSIGGIISLGLVTTKENQTPLYSAETFVDLMRTQVKKIFSKSDSEFVNFIENVSGYFSAKYSPNALETLLTYYFKDIYLSSAIKPILVTSVSSNSSPYNFDSVLAKNDPFHDFFMRDVGRATSAAPTFFPAAKIQNRTKTNSLTLIDGGLYINNPSKLVFNKLQNFYQCTPKEIAMVSLGTGSFSDQEFSDDVGKIKAIEPVIDTMMRSNSMGVDQEMLGILGDKKYFRIQASLEKKIDLDDTSEENLDILELLAGEQFREIENLTRFLLINYDRKKDLF